MTAIGTDDNRSLRERVEEAWKNAVANGEDFSTWTDREVALDMCYCSADMELEKVADVQEQVAIIRKLPKHG